MSDPKQLLEKLRKAVNLLADTTPAGTMFMFTLDEARAILDFLDERSRT